MYFLKTVAVSTLVASSSAATLFLRGSSIECTSARAQIVSAIDQATNVIAKIKDQSVADAAKDAMVGASTGISQIVKAITSLHGAPTANPDIVREALAVHGNLKSVARALDKGDTSDPSVVAAQKTIQTVQKAEKTVMATC